MSGDRTNSTKVVLKLGGSVLTMKDVDDFPLEVDEIKQAADEYIRYDDVRRIGKEIKEALDGKGMELIIVNGAGPFGHSLVKHKRPDEDVRESVKHLNDRLVSEFKKIGLKVVPVAPSKSCEFVDGEFDINYLWEVTSTLLEEGKILSTYGDVLDGGKVISGDDLIVLLAKEWKADRVITATDVDGVFTKNPDTHKDAVIIKRLNVGDASVQYTSTKTDVTGEMSSKVKKLEQAAEHGIKVQIINGLKRGNIKSALLGDESIGTLVVA